MKTLRWTLPLAAAAALAGPPVRYVGKTVYLNGAVAAVTHTFDDSHTAVLSTLDALDRYGVKATAFVSTERKPIEQLWPRLNKAIADGHEVGSHSRRHQCKWPDTEEICRQFYDDYEVAGSRDDILKNTKQPYVWSWCYPCGNCANYEFAWKKLAEHGYIAARNYPGEEQDLHNVPNLMTWADNPLNSAYTQVVQKKGGIAKSGRTDVAELNAKFDEVYARGGIYHFLSHPAWLDFGPDSFYELHLSYISRRPDVWYVPFGPLHAYRRLRESTEVRELGEGRFTVLSNLDPKVYSGSVTLEFRADTNTRVLYGRRELKQAKRGETPGWDAEFVRADGDRTLVTIRPGRAATTLEFR
ncbi:MAG: polysaccharide deacetylase family protein [Bryobacteraceae bacterium]